MSYLDLPRDPVELASVRAEQSTSGAFAPTEQVGRLLAELDYMADSMGFLGENYFIETHRAIIAPASFEADQPVKLTDFMGLTLEGKFACYSKLHIGRLIGRDSVRAVCLTFESATLLPFFDTMRDEDLLYVPVLAVKSIMST